MNLAQIIGLARLHSDAVPDTIGGINVSLIPVQGTRPIVGRVFDSGLAAPMTRTYPNRTTGCAPAVRAVFASHRGQMRMIDVVQMLSPKFKKGQIWGCIADSRSFVRVERGVYQITKLGREIYLNDVRHAQESDS